jgi:hypothetical protein
MKALYNCSFADPWVEVAKILKDKYNIEPVYWVGHDDDFSRDLVPDAFPDAVYHEYFDAWKGVFPQEIEKIANRYGVDVDFYQRISKFELQGLKLMDRMDANQKSFGFSERRNLFRKFLRYWIAITDYYKVDIVISPVMPHRSFDFPLYLVCKEKGIKLFGFFSTPFSSAGRIIGGDDIYSIPDKIKQDYQILSKNKNPVKLAQDIQSNIDAVRKTYRDAIPPGLLESTKFFKKKPSALQTGLKFLNELFTKRTVWFGKNGWLINGVPTYHKDPKKKVERSKSRQKLIPYSFRIYKRIRFLRSLEKEYSKIQRKPDLTKPYAIFALHYQPEATTMPRAGVFYDHLYILELLSKYLPSDWNIYIKENPKQFNPVSEGETGRLLRFYQDAVRFPRVQFVPLKTDPFLLIDYAKVVVTITGTMGWEALVRKKPVICFGPSWYDSFSNSVLRIQNTNDLEKMTGFIKNHKYSKQKLFTYLKAIENNSILAYFRRGLKKKMNLNQNQCIDQLVCHVTNYLELSSNNNKKS